MKKHKIAPIPPPHEKPFIGAIQHPELWLWDSWTSESFEMISLYCLALSRFDAKRKPILPSQRNKYSFHIRLFTSTDEGNVWFDHGSVLTPGTQYDNSDNRNIWSGSVYEVGDTIMLAYTGLKNLSENRNPLQTICLAHANGRQPNFIVSQEALSDPIRDYEKILSSGYYLGKKDELGINKGKGPEQIVAWHDPFLFEEEDGTLYAFWTAKSAKYKLAIAWATIEISENGLRLGKLLPPINLPVARSVTQLALPKIYRDRRDKMYYCLVSVSDQTRERQADNKISKEIHLYRSSSLQDSWEPYNGKTPKLEGFSDVFGASLFSVDCEEGTASIIAPYTEQANSDVRLSFPEVRQIKFKETE